MAVKNWLIEEHRSAIWAASRDQLLSSAWRMLSFRPGRQTGTRLLQLDFNYDIKQSFISMTNVLNTKGPMFSNNMCL